MFWHGGSDFTVALECAFLILFVTLSKCNPHRFKTGSSNKANLLELLHIAYFYNSFIM